MSRFMTNNPVSKAAGRRRARNAALLVVATSLATTDPSVDHNVHHQKVASPRLTIRDFLLPPEMFALLPLAIVAAMYVVKRGMLTVEGPMGIVLDALFIVCSVTFAFEFAFVPVVVGATRATRWLRN